MTDFWMKVVFYYLLIINAVAFFLYGIDKLKAKHGKWRISELTLLLFAAAGGAVGAWVGMKIWHHKTQHWKFKIGLPLILVLQLGIAVYWMWIR